MSAQMPAPGSIIHFAQMYSTGGLTKESLRLLGQDIPVGIVSMFLLGRSIFDGYYLALQQVAGRPANAPRPGQDPAYDKALDLANDLMQDGIIKAAAVARQIDEIMQHGENGEDVSVPGYLLMIGSQILLAALTGSNLLQSGPSMVARMGDEG